MLSAYAKCVWTQIKRERRERLWILADGMQTTLSSTNIRYHPLLRDSISLLSPLLFRNSSYYSPCGYLLLVSKGTGHNHLNKWLVLLMFYWGQSGTWCHSSIWCQITFYNFALLLRILSLLSLLLGFIYECVRCVCCRQWLRTAPSPVSALKTPHPARLGPAWSWMAVAAVRCVLGSWGSPAPCWSLAIITRSSTVTTHCWVTLRLAFA